MHSYLQPVKHIKIAVQLLFPTHLSARFVPLVHKECALEDEVFEDGAETQMECNKCVCACGNWVCTALACNGGFVPVRLWCRNAKGMGFTFFFFCLLGEHHSQELAGEGGEEKEMTEEEWSRRVAELKALQVQ